MGIKFQCANGHELHVKAFLAGKRGKCPKCGVAVEIPAAQAADVAIDLELQDDPASAIEIDMPVPAAPSAGRKAVSVTAAPGRPASKPTSLNKDPIAEVPQASWYVRHADGGQYGPAAGAVLREWVAQGRVAHDSLVWRDDWSEWQSASSVFPELMSDEGEQETAAPQNLSEEEMRLEPLPQREPDPMSAFGSAPLVRFNPEAHAVSAPKQIELPSIDPTSQYVPLSPRRVPIHKTQQWKIMTVVLVIVSLVLLAIFVYVVTQSKQQNKPAGLRPSAASQMACSTSPFTRASALH